MFIYIDFISDRKKKKKKKKKKKFENIKYKI